MPFDSFGLHPDLMKGIRDMGYREPTPIQKEAIPVVLSGKDVIAHAQTGTGKTAAFLLPIIHRIASETPGGTRALILVPTRELAMQIDEHTLGLAYHTHVKASAIYGGVPMEPQERAFFAGTSIIAATPGRLIDLHRYGSWRFDKLEVLVLDEADRMLDMGFLPDIQWILSKLPPVQQKLLFSATMPPEILRLVHKYLKDPAQIKIGLIAPPSKIVQAFYCVHPTDKTRLLMELLRKTYMHSVIAFVKTKGGAERLYRYLQRQGIEAGVIHGDKEQKVRDKVMVDFKNDHIQILVATDIAARGIDIGGVSHIVNFDIPDDPDSYIHRIGRTARAEADGDAVTFFEPEEAVKVREIERALGKKIRTIRWGNPDRPTRPGRSGPSRQNRHQRPRHPSRRFNKHKSHGFRPKRSHHRPGSSS